MTVIFLPSKNSILKFVDFLTRPHQYKKKKSQIPHNINQNIFYFSDLKPCHLNKVVEILTGVLHNHNDFGLPSGVPPSDFEELPSLFPSDTDVYNYSFNQIVHALDTKMTSLVPFLGSQPQNNSDMNFPIMESSQKCIPFPKKVITTKEEGLYLPPPTLNFQNKTIPSQGLC